jgi:protein-S-isoprenylcysteine O-methyltransferase Ste14
MKIGEALYKHRGLVPVIPILYSVVAADPRTHLLIVGLCLMALGEGIRLWAAAHLGLIARSSSPRAIKLVTSGPYAHTRHPLYWGNFCLTLGYCMASGAGSPWFGIVVTLGFFALYSGHARREESTLAVAFPDEYEVYRKRVPGFLWAPKPRTVPAAGDIGTPSIRRALRVEALTLNAEFWLLVALWARVRWIP